MFTYNKQANVLAEFLKRTTEYSIQNTMMKVKNWLKLLYGIFFLVCIAKPSSTKCILFQMMYKRDTVTPFELADKQRDDNPLPPSL